MIIDNEYIDGDKRYINNICKCVCSEKRGDYYVLQCNIVQRGEHEYFYEPGFGYIKKDLGNKKLWLTDNSAAQADAAMRDLNEKIEKAQIAGYSFDMLPECDFSVYYESKSFGKYSCLVRFTDSENVLRYVCYDSLRIGEIIRDIAWLARNYDFGDLLIDSTKDTIVNNPFYISAVKNNNKQLQKQLKLYYRIATEKECSWLSKLFGVKILPSLPKAFDKPYYIDSDTISIKTLSDSGYEIAHRPYFAMGDSTHSIWQLNPHAKKGVDAAPVNSTISFKEYIEIIESNMNELD